jgi:hypothetical protein
MGANAVTTVPVYTAGEILTAADLNITNSGIPVFADSTARDAAFGGTGEKTLAEGQYAYLESTNATQYYDGAAWQPVGTSAGLVRIGSASLSANPTNITNVFSTTYKNYKIVIDNAVATGRGYMFFRIGANVSTSIYYYASMSRVSSGTTSNIEGNAQTFIRFTNWENATTSNIRAIGATIEIQNPFEALNTTLQENHAGGSIVDLWAGFSGGLINDTTSYTGFTIGAESGTLTGTVTVYGYANS